MGISYVKFDTHRQRLHPPCPWPGGMERLARLLLLLAHGDEHRAVRYSLPKISRTRVAEMSGMTRSKVDTLMNHFRKLGFLQRNSERDGGLQIHRSMLSVVLQG